MLLNATIDMILNVMCNRGMSKTHPDADRIRDLGGPTAVARLLGYVVPYPGVPRVSNWMTRGIPPSVKVARPDLFMPELVAANEASGR